MSDPAWPELEASNTITTSKAPEWSLRTESELHVERLEAKLESIKKRNDRTNNKSARHPHPALSSSEAGRRPTPTASQPLLFGSRSGGGGSGSTSYGSDTRIRIPGEGFDSHSETDSENEEEEDRLEQAKAQAKDVDEYLVKDRNRHCRTTCCIIS
ncbi:hypothetical protein BG015_010554 [Linnemannia schmuckeri]|uniref:Uncharacterized protein n=1 Tax=Linnemannia schmuckeri TaxID=64567 RepID=A0A9P5VE50_9FUNG|nr:hypothetical protein BG015_010554 [Linnemannia schmuckeri]